MRSSPLSAFLSAAIALSLHGAHAAIYTEPSQLPSGRQYDYVIVGGAFIRYCPLVII